MFCKQILALFLWCHCYQIVFDPFVNLLTSSLLHNPGLGDIRLDQTFYHHQPLTLVKNRLHGQISPIPFDRPSTRDALNNLHEHRRLMIGPLVSHSIRSSSYVAAIAQSMPMIQAAKFVALSPGQEIVLRCQIEGVSNPEFAWYRRREFSKSEKQSPDYQPPTSDGLGEPLNKTDTRFIIGPNSITIKSSTYSDVGDYSCSYIGNQDDVRLEKSEETIQVRPRPYIEDFDIETATYKSVVVEEGKSLKLDCVYGDEYYPDESLHAKWYMEKIEGEPVLNEVKNDEDGITLEQETLKLSLKIDRVTKDHRRTYKCQVTNGVTDISKDILIRVKDKYVAIWPAAFIVGELVILMAVILFAENRKVEQDKEFYDRKAKL